MATKFGFTRKGFFEGLLNGTIELGTEEVNTFLEHLIDVESKSKKTSPSELAKKSANESLKNDIEDFLQNEGGEYSITSLINTCDFLNGLSNQKVSRMCSELVAEGRIAKDKRGGTTIFKSLE